MKGYDSAHGIDSTDVVTNGADSDARFGDVYGVVVSPTYNQGAATATGLVQWTPGTPALIPANFFKGFIFRNSGVRRGRPSGSGPAPWKIVTANTAQSNTTDPVTFTLAASNTCASDLALNNTAGSNSQPTFELRKITSYFGVPGRGTMSPGLVPGARPARVGTTSGLINCGSGNPVCSSGQNPYWTSDDVGGVYHWGNRRRIGAPSGYSNWSTSSGETALGGGFQKDYIFRYFAWFNTLFATDVHSLQFHPGETLDSTELAIKPLFDRGYRWDDTVAAGSSPETRVGADWGIVVSDPVTGEVIYNTMQIPFHQNFDHSISQVLAGIRILTHLFPIPLQQQPRRFLLRQAPPSQ